MEIYQEGMLCKHFKGTNLYEKNIYRIVKLHVDGSTIDESIVTYTGEGILSEANDLVVYANIFQDNKLFAREYADITSELSEEKKQQSSQTLRVEPLNEEEIAIISNPEFVAKKTEFVAKKFKR